MKHPAPMLALTAFAVYAVLSPTVSGLGDGSEFTLVLATNGVAHPTGYPLYTLFGHAFCVLLHWLGAPWALAANLWSAAGAAVGIGFLGALAMELAGASSRTAFLAALPPVWLFAFQPILLREATSAEVNAWSLAWACGAAYGFVRMLRAVAGGTAMPPSRLRRGAALWGAVCGAGLAHHLTSALVAAPLTAALVIAARRQRRLSPSLCLVALGAALVPVASYGIIAWRAWHPARFQWPWLGPSLADVLGHISGVQYQLFLGHFAPDADQQKLLTRIAYPFLLVGSGCLLLGLARARSAGGMREAWAGLLCAALLVAGFTFSYGVPDPAPYFLPVMALGAAAAAPALTALPGAGSRAWSAAMGIAWLLGLFATAPWIRDANEERKAILQYEDMVRSMWSAIPPDTALVFWSDDRYLRLQEYQTLRGEKPALIVAHPDLLFEPQARRRLSERLGFEPLAGVRIPKVTRSSPEEGRIIERTREEAVRWVNERSKLPVIVFDPSVPIVRRLRKPWESGEASAGPSADRPRVGGAPR